MSCSTVLRSPARRDVAEYASMSAMRDGAASIRITRGVSQGSSLADVPSRILETCALVGDETENAPSFVVACIVLVLPGLSH